MKSRLYNNISRLHLIEKLCFFRYSNKPLLLNNLKLDSAVIMFRLKNESSNKSLFMSNLVLLERIFGQQLTLISSAEDNLHFNIRRDTIIGAKLTVDLNDLNIFIHNLLNYSLRKLRLYYRIGLFDSKLIISNRVLRSIDIGFTKLMFFNILSNHSDWDDFSYIYDQVSYGLDFHLISKINNIYITRLLLSHYSIGIY